MGRRRRQKVQVRPRKKLPKIFDCPKCGKNSITIEINKPSTLEGRGVAIITCGHPDCKLQDSVEITFISDPVDAYGDFIDRYYEKLEKGTA
ncbi:MAG: transcription elongation factor [Candidatus Helarchaeales archaeon]